jgi:hypothetical protein
VNTRAIAAKLTFVNAHEGKPDQLRIRRYALMQEFDTGTAPELFSPLEVGSLLHEDRVVMGPLTRSHADLSNVSSRLGIYIANDGFDKAQAEARTRRRPVPISGTGKSIYSDQAASRDSPNIIPLPVLEVYDICESHKKEARSPGSMVSTPWEVLPRFLP